MSPNPNLITPDYIIEWCKNRQNQDFNITPKYRMKVLELFSGTGSVKKICDEYGFDCVSIDIDDKFHPVDIKADILTWDYKIYKPGDFDIIWASPPCATFSSLLPIRKTKEQIIELMNNIGLPLLNRAREIIDYLKPDYYFIENPKTGRMKDYITDLPYHDVTYCHYGFTTFKPTRIWTNLDSFEPKYCRKGSYCNQKVNNKHPGKIGMTRSTPNGKFGISNIGNKTKLAEKYAIPPDLIRSIFDSI